MTLTCKMCHIYFNSWFKFFGLGAILFLYGCAAQDDIIKADIDEFVEQVMSCGNIPGLALTVVSDGQVSVLYADIFNN